MSVMSQTEDVAKQYSLPPPSYEEAVFGTSTDAQNDSLPFTEAPVHTPYAQQAAHHSPQQLPTTQYYSPQYHTSNTYSMCPAGAQPLCNLSEILVYPSQGRKFKVKDQNKTTIMRVRYEWESECCNCCNFENVLMYTLQSVDGQMTSAQGNMLLDSFNCCSYSKRHIEVKAPLGVSVGTVRIDSDCKCSVENQSGDVLYELKREKGCCEVSPYQIYKTDGQIIGQIDHSRGIKHRLTVPKEMPVQRKILLLFFTVHLQAEADARRRSN